MTKLLKTLIPTALVVAGLAFFAHAQGMLQGLPIVGGASYCGSTQNNVCVSTIAAGPAVITGAENIPGDTNLSGGRSPQTVKFSMASLNLLPDAYSTVTAGSAFYAYTLPNTTGRVTFVATGTVSDARVTAPPSPVDGQRACVGSTHTITAFQFIANTTVAAQTLAVSTPTVVTASTTVPQGYCWTYRASDLKWYRTQ